MKYFYSKREVEAYLRSQNDNREVESTPSWWDGDKTVYDKCKAIPGCKVGLVWSEPYIERPQPYIEWKGTKMRFSGYRHDKTRSMVLIERLETYGYNINEISTQGKGKPNDIGTPTAKKLDDWRNYLLALRKADNEHVASVIRMCESHKQMCKAMFPEGTASDATYNQVSWHFSYEHGGLTYTCEIYQCGTIHEDLKVTYEGYHQKEDTLTKAFLMMQNPYTPLKKETA